MEYGSENSEKHPGGKLEHKAIDKDAVDIGAHWTAGSDLIVDQQASLRLR